MSEKVSFEKILPEMESMGFELEDLGGGSYAVNSVPGGLEGLNPLKLVPVSYTHLIFLPARMSIIRPTESRYFVSSVSRKLSIF